jgi:hypothetical protein
MILLARMREFASIVRTLRDTVLVRKTNSETDKDLVKHSVRSFANDVSLFAKLVGQWADVDYFKLFLSCFFRAFWQRGEQSV